jgi:hypothetical protein
MPEMADGSYRTVWLSLASRAKVMAKEKASVRTSMFSRSV